MRTIQTLLNPQDAMDGAGVKIKRHSIVRLGLADPFLMLDEIYCRFSAAPTSRH